VRLDFDGQLLSTTTATKSDVCGSSGISESSNKRRRIDRSTTRTDAAAPVPIEPKDIHRVIRAAMESCFGVVGAGMAHTIRVSLYDETDRLAIIKMPRESCAMVRSALAFLTSINDVNVVISTIGVHGSARTVKIAALAELRRIFNERNKLVLGDTSKTDGDKKLTKEKEKVLLKLEARMNKVRDVD